MPFKIATFNVNSIRSRLPVLLEWLEKQRPDVLCVQETKVEDRDFPAAPLEEAGYRVAFFGQKRWNGVAILSRHPLSGVSRGLQVAGPPGKPETRNAGPNAAGSPEEADASPAGTGVKPAGDAESGGEARLIRAECAGVVILNAYVPQGRGVDDPQFAYKLAWLEALGDLLHREHFPAKPLLLCGDLNHVPEPMDVYDPEGLRGHVCYHPEVDRVFRKLLAWGLTDLFRKCCQEPGQYSFFDYRIPNAVKRGMGWRLDHILVTEPLAARAAACFIDLEPRLKTKPSDHTPVVAEFDHD